MVRRYIFKKWDTSEDTTKCDFCPNQTLYFILDKKTGEESWCCLECALKRFKIKRLKGLLKKYPIRKKKTILVQIPLIKNSTNDIQSGTSTPNNSQPEQSHSGSTVQETSEVQK